MWKEKFCQQNLISFHLISAKFEGTGYDNGFCSSFTLAVTVLLEEGENNWSFLYGLLKIEIPAVFEMEPSVSGGRWGKVTGSWS